MDSVLSLIGIVALAYIATNVDNTLLLVAVISRDGQPFASVVGGALLAATAMLAVCLAAAFAADLAPQRWLGWLGLVPIALGLRELHRLFTADSGAPARGVHAGAIGPLAVATVLLSNSADSFAALAPIFAETRDSLLPLIAGVVLGASLLAVALAHWIATHARAGPLLRRIGPRVVPFVLIAVGLFVLSDTWTDTELP